MYVNCRTSPPWWWTGQSQSCWSRCSRTWWPCGRNPVLHSHCPKIKIQIVWQGIQNLGVNAGQRYVERRCVHQVVPSPLPRAWTHFQLDILPSFLSFFPLFSKPPPMSLNTFSTRCPPIVYPIFPTCLLWAWTFWKNVKKCKNACCNIIWQNST